MGLARCGFALAVLLFSAGLSHAEGTTSLRVSVADLILASKFAEAEPRAKQWLALAERSGLGSSEVGDALETLVKIYAGLNRFDDAEAAWRRCLTLRIELVGSKHALISHTIDIMAGIYSDQGRKKEAQALWRDGLAAFHKGATVAALEGLKNPPDTANRRASVSIEKGNPRDAESALRQNGDQEELATFLLDRGRQAEAVAIHRRLLDLAPTSNRAVNMATLYRQRGLGAIEQEFLHKAIAIQEKLLGDTHSDLIPTLTALAASFEKQNDVRKAYAALKRVSAIASAARTRQAFTAPAAVALNMRKPHADFLRISALLARERAGEQAGLASETFEAGQLLTETVLSATVSQMGLRLSKGSGPLPELIRKRQDLEREWQRLDRLLLTAVTGQAAQGERDDLRLRLAAAERELAATNVQLRRSFPQYFELASPTPLKVADAQALLRPNEALVQFAITVDQAYLWIVTKSAARWVPISKAPSEIEAAVAALRCGLDYEGSWGPRARPETTRRCRDLVRRSYTEADSRVPRPLPFDLGRAHELYVALFGQVEELLAGKELLLVPSGPLSSLPLQVLVTRRADTGVPSDWAGYAQAQWLAKAHALTVLPSANSLKALRAQAGHSQAAKPYLAFANPVLFGSWGTDRRAAQRQKCEDGRRGVEKLARAPAVRGLPARFIRGELGITEKIRELQPLVETADEVCAVAEELGGSTQDVLLGPNATERALKALSASGALETYRVVHFATHGLLASETEIEAGGPAEPALVLTPPDRATQEDDGLLTSGEILQLKLNADWVILSACNTASGENTGADALSGLARAVIYAGSRALLVSHWAVDSEATVQLISRTFRSVRADPVAGRGHALRSAMLGMISASQEGSHPAYWAPFIVVGENGPLR